MREKINGMEILAQLKSAKNELYPIIKPNDLIRVCGNYRKDLHCYEVDDVDDEGIITTGEGYFYSWIDILAIFRFDGVDYKCIWRKQS